MVGTRPLLRHGRVRFAFTV